MGEEEESQEYFPISMESLVFDYLTLDISNKQQNQILSDICKIGETRTQDIVDYAENLWKKYKFHQAGLRLLRLFVSLHGYNKEKLLPTIFMVLNVIDKSRIRNQYIAACRCIAKIITAKDFPKTITLDQFGVFRFLDQKELDAQAMSKFADAYGDCIIKVTDKNLPSFHYARVNSSRIPRDIYIEKVIPKIERQLLRSAESFIGVATRILPSYDFPVTPKSLAQVLLNLISNNAAKTEAPKLLPKVSPCFNPDDLFKAGIATLKSCKNFESKGVLAQSFSAFNANKISQETLEQYIQLIQSEKQADVQNNLIIVLKSAPDRSLPLFKNLTMNNSNIAAICAVLFECSKSDDVVSFIHPSFNLSPASVARVLIKQGVKLTKEEEEAILGPTKFMNDKFEALLMNGQASQCVDIFMSAPKQFTNNALAIPEDIVAPLVDQLVINPNFEDDIILKFAQKVKKSPSSFDRLTLCILWPSKVTKEDVPRLLELFGLRRNLVGRSLSEAGFTKEQYDHVKNAFDAYLDNPLSQEDIQFILCQDEIDLSHPSAKKYAEMKDEIAHPNATTNLPQLKKQFEKQKPKVIEQQKQIKKELNETRVQPVLDSIYLLTCHFKNERKPITASLTSLTRYLLDLRDVQIFTDDVENCLFSCLTRVPAFRTMPRTILAILTHDNETLDHGLLKYLVPSGALSDVMLHMIASDLPALLSDKEYCTKFCDPEAITNETDIDLLLPIYLEHSNLSQEIFDFTVALCNDIPVSSGKLKVAFDSMLDNDSIIRSCALNCIGVSRFDIKASPLFICQLHIHAVNDELAKELINSIEPEFEMTPERINEVYSELFNRNSTDDVLQKNIGLSYGDLMGKNKDTATKFLTEIYKKNSQKVESYDVPIQNNARIAISYAFVTLKPITPACIDFITLVALKDTVDIVRENMTKVCEFYIGNFQKEDLPDLFNRFYEPLNLPPVSSPENNRLRICLVQLCSKIVNTDYNRYGKQLLDCLIKYNTRSNSDELRDISAKTISALAKKNAKEIPQMIEDLQKTIDQQDTFEKLLGYAYSYCALLHAQGVKSLQSGIFDTTETLSKSKRIDDRCLACFFFAGLSFMFGAILELSLPKVLPVLLALFGDKVEIVRTAAEKAIQSIVKNLTHACVERVLPYALDKVENDASWRVQQAAILLVEAVLRNKPKNIVKYVPNLVQSLGVALKSATSSIRDNAVDTIELLKTSIANEAVVDIFDYIVQAISNPSSLPIAIDKIMHLNLIKRLDQTDLSLIIPIIASGCNSPNLQLKTDSLKIFGQLPNIAIESAIDQFSDEIIPPLLNGVSDSAPNVRAISAASLSSVVVCLKSEKYDQIMDTLIQEMTTKKSFSERQGNSQAIASLIKAHGVEQLDSHLQSFVDLAKNSKDLKVREGYISLLGFLSHFFGEEFSSGFDISIEAVLDACADPNDAIRTVGLRSASLIAKTFSLSHPQLILKPYFACALKENWRQRLCAVNFMKSFVMATTGTTEADDKGIRTIGELLMKLEAAVDKELLYPALITLWILSADPVPTVSQEAQLVWRQAIPNTGNFLRNAMDILLERISVFTHSEYEVVRTVGAYAMANSIRKLKTRFLKKCFECIEEQLDEQDIDAVHGAILDIHLMIELLTQEEKIHVCEMLAPFLSSPFTIIRQESFEAFVQMRDSLGEQGAREVTSSLVRYVFQKASADSDVSYLSGLLNILGHNAMVDLSHKILHRPLTEDRPIIAQRIVGAADKALDEVMPTFAERVISMSAHPPTELDGKLAVGIAENVIDVLSERNKKVFCDKLVENMRSQQPQNRQASIVIGGYLLRKVSSSFNDVVRALVRASLYLFDDPLDDIQNLAIESIAGVSKEIPIDDIPALIKEVCDTLESLCTVTKVRAFSKPESFEALNLILEDSFKSNDHGAVFCACSILATVVPQLDEPPVTTRKLLAHCVLALQLFSDNDIQLKILKGSRALFEKAASERQMLTYSLPMSYIRLFRSGKLAIQSAAADALCCYAQKISAPIIVIRCLLQIVRTQILKVSSTVINAIITIVKNIKLTKEECDETVYALTPLFKHSKMAMRELAAIGVSATLLSSPVDYMVEKILGNTIIDFSNDQFTHTSIVILDDILKNKSPQIIDKILPFVMDKLKNWQNNNSDEVRAIYPKICMTCIICMPSLLDKLLPYVLDIFQNGEVEQQVVACQELHRLIAIIDKLSSSDAVEILKCLMSAYDYGSPAVQSAAATSIFDLYHLDEKDDNQIKSLATKMDDPKSIYNSFKSIIEQVQTDRANQRNAK